MQQLTLENTVQRIDNEVAETDLDGNIVLLHIEHGKYYNFNAVSSDLWSSIKTPTTIKSLVEYIYQKYDCSMEQSSDDVLSFMHELLSRNLLMILT